MKAELLSVLEGGRICQSKGQGGNMLWCEDWLSQALFLFLTPAATGRSRKGKGCKQSVIEILNIFLFRDS